LKLRPTGTANPFSLFGAIERSTTASVESSIDIVMVPAPV
jgi:hypothetical protein